MELLSSRVQEARVQFRERYRSRFYSPWVHLALFNGLGIAVIAYSASLIRDLRAWQLLVIPATLLFGNAVEYFFHRGPMHHPRPGARMIFERHTLQHHFVFTEEEFEIASSKDLDMVLFPIWALPLVAVVGFPFALLAEKFLPPNLVHLFALTAMGYFFNYEWFHMIYHLPEDSLLGRMGIFRKLKQHHRAHHTKALMSRYNFNITFPICDRLFGTIAPTMPRE